MVEECNGKCCYNDEAVKSASRSIRIHIHACKNKKKHDKLITKRYSKFIAQKNKDFGDDVWGVIKSFIVTDFYVDSQFLPKPNTRILTSNDWRMENLTVELGKRCGYNFIMAKKVWELNDPVTHPFTLHKIYRGIIKHPTKPNKLCMSEEIETKWCFLPNEPDERHTYRDYWLYHILGYDQRIETTERLAVLQKMIEDDESFVTQETERWVDMMESD